MKQLRGHRGGTALRRVFRAGIFAIALAPLASPGLGETDVGQADIEHADIEQQAEAERAAGQPASIAPAGPPGGETASALLARAFDNLYAEDYVQTMMLAARTRGSKEVSKTLQIIRKQSERPGKALVRFVAPSSIRRTSVLILEKEGANDDLYIYIPALRRTKRLSASQRADAFFGTDLSYEDVEPKRASDFVASFVPAEDLEGRGDCTRVVWEAAPEIESTYERMISCIDPEHAVIASTDFYRDGKLIKHLVIDPADVRQVGERHIPFTMTMTTPSKDSVTRVVTESYDLQRTIPDRLFTTWNLESGDAKADLGRLPD